MPKLKMMKELKRIQLLLSNTNGQVLDSRAFRNIRSTHEKLANLSLQIPKKKKGMKHRSRSDLMWQPRKPLKKRYHRRKKQRGKNLCQNLSLHRRRLKLSRDPTSS